MCDIIKMLILLLELLDGLLSTSGKKLILLISIVKALRLQLNVVSKHLVFLPRAMHLMCPIRGSPPLNLVSGGGDNASVWR